MFVFKFRFRRDKNFLSFLGRKIFERKDIKRFFGAFLVISIPVLSVFNSPALAFELAKIKGSPLVENEITLNTTLSSHSPVNGSVSQKFSFFHPGWDIVAPYGESVYPLIDGVVIETNTLSWGYGRYIVISHSDGFQTLYAHLSKIEVKVGEKVTKEKVIGQIGTSGWSSGPHLHFEVWQDGKPLNPIEVLGENLTQSAIQ